MGTLYVVGVPAGDAEDLTLRARSVLSEAACIVVDDLDAVSGFPALHDVDTPLVHTSDTSSLLRALDLGDAALLSCERSPCPTHAAVGIVRTAVARGHRVSPVPGPVWPLSSLVLSGLPADSFVFLGDLPDHPKARATLLSTLQTEQRTLVLTASAGDLPHLLSELRDLLGERPLVITRLSSNQTVRAWRGTLGIALDTVPDVSPEGPAKRVIVIGGAGKSAGRWEEEHLRTAALACLERGLGVKETSQQLAAKSGWTRREVYQVALDLHRHRRHAPPIHTNIREGGPGGTHDKPG